MEKKIRSCVFISGNGSNLYYIIKNSRNYNFPIKIQLVISNNNTAKGISIAKKYNIPVVYIPYRNQNYFERAALDELKKK